MSSEIVSVAESKTSATVKVHTLGNTVSLIEAAVNKPLMEAIRDGGAPIRAECGGACSCATCHVYFDESVLPRLAAATEDEKALLEMAEGFGEKSRLSCQVMVEAWMDGMEVWLAPGSE